MFFASLTEWSPQNIFLRLLLAFILGTIIGIDRGVKRRGGGARTDAAVCLGAATVMITAQYMTIFCGGTDISRIPAQVVSGVGFLGAGSIIVSRHQIKGLTSAAGIWICACIGLTAGIGFTDGAVFSTLILLAGLHLIPMFEERIYQHSRYLSVYIEISSGQATSSLLHKLKRDSCTIDVYDVERPKTEDQPYTILATVCLPAKQKKEDFIRSLSDYPGVITVDSM